jgi:hypothetical protein
VPRTRVQIASHSEAGCKRLVFSDLESGICGGPQPAVLAAVEWSGLRLDRATPAYDGAADVNKARTCAAIASVPLSVLPKTTRT